MNTPRKTAISTELVRHVTGQSLTDNRNILARAGAAVRYAITGKLAIENETAWMPPGQIMPPVAQEEAGRLWDYPVGGNPNTTPRGNEPISFGLMRAMADGYDLMRLVIEKRKDQMEKLEWRFVTTKATEEDKGVDPRIKELSDFFETPDRINSWGTWLRMALEDMLVIDALTLYPRLDNGGHLYSLDVMDGATIKVVVDHQGRRPEAPQAAYVQQIKGAPMANYSVDELVYHVRNPRSNRLYGFSPVEQVLATVNIALRRQTHQLHFYTEGNIPEAFIPTPEGWTGKQINEFQKIWDQMMADPGEMRKAKFIPNVKSVIFTRPQDLKDMMDDWLARIICFAFSYPPSALVHQVNRATAQTAQETAEEEGLTPLMNSVKILVDKIVKKYFGYDDITFQWRTDKVLDPTALAVIHTQQLLDGRITIDEARKELGKAPFAIEGQTNVPSFLRQITPQQQHEADQAQLALNQKGEPPVNGAGKKDSGAAAAGGSPSKNPKVQSEAQSKAGNKAQKLAKSADDIAYVNSQDLAYQQRGVVRKAEKKFTAILTVAFQSEAARIAEAYAAKFGKADNASDAANFADTITIDLSGARKAIVTELDAVAADGASQSLARVDIADESILTLANSRAKEYATQRAGELITQGAAGGQISDTTTKMLRVTLAQAAEEGQTNEQVAKTLRESYAFSAQRAETIARTELRAADVQGNLAGYKASGVVKGTRWLLSNEHDSLDLYEECTINAMQGFVKLGEVYESGDEGPPAHPNCQCDVAPVITEDGETP